MIETTKSSQPIAPEQFVLYSELISSGQIEVAEAAALLDRNPEFRKWLERQPR